MMVLCHICLAVVHLIGGLCAIQITLPQGHWTQLTVSVSQQLPGHPTDRKLDGSSGVALDVSGCFWIISMLFNAALSIAEPWLLSNSGHFQEELAQAWHKHGTSMAHQAGLCWLNSDLTLAATSALPASRKQWTAFSQWSMAAAGPPGPLPSQMPAALSYLRHLDSKEKPTKQT